MIGIHIEISIDLNLVELNIVSFNQIMKIQL
jgi:hypothetical protein